MSELSILYVAFSYVMIFGMMFSKWASGKLHLSHLTYLILAPISAPFIVGLRLVTTRNETKGE